jgi:hypothetical protein
VLNGSRAALPSARAKKRRLATTSRNGVLQSRGAADAAQGSEIVPAGGGATVPAPVAIGGASGSVGQAVSSGLLNGGNTANEGLERFATSVHALVNQLDCELQIDVDDRDRTKAATTIRTAASSPS